MKRSAVALGCLAICALLWTASASAQPVGLVEEFYVGGWTYSLTPGPGGDVWFSFDRDPVRKGDAAIGRITPQGKTTLFTKGLDPRSGPGGMALGPDGNLWFADDGKRPAIGRITPQGTITEFRSGLDPKSRPGAVVSGPDGNLWFSDVGRRRAIGRITPDGTITEFRDGLDPKAVPFGIVVGPDGNLWFGDTTKAIGRITPQGAITELGPAPSAVGSLVAPVVGPDGNIWTVGGSPLGFVQVSPLGTTSQFSAGTGSLAGLLGPLAAGPDGNVWFTSRGGGPAVGPGHAERGNLRIHRLPAQGPAFHRSQLDNGRPRRQRLVHQPDHPQPAQHRHAAGDRQGHAERRDHRVPRGDGLRQLSR